MTSCCVCLEEFPDWKVNNPRYCCSAKLCQTCANATKSCPQCRYKVGLDQGLMSDAAYHLRTASFRCYSCEGCLCLEWFKDGKLDRTDEPAYICYYESGQIRREQYCKDGKLDRTDGPAYILYHEDGKIKLYYIDGELMIVS